MVDRVRPTRHAPLVTLVATGLGLFMIFLDASIVNVALPDIQRDFHTGESGIQWVVAGYSVTMAMFMMAGGTLGDLRGRRRAYLLGLAIFSVSSVACALAPDIDVLTAARAVQGAGAAVINVASLALVGAAFPEPSAKTNAIGIWTGIAAIGFGIGPAVGGVLTEHVGWRGVFVFNPVVGAIAVALTVAYVRESSDPGDRGFDLPGQVLFVAGIGAFTFGLIQGPHLGWLSPTTVAVLAGSAALLTAFTLLELRTPRPMMDLRVFRRRVFSVAIYVVFAVMFCVYGTLLVITQYFQNVREYSPERAGVLTMAMAAPIVVLAPLTGRIVAAYGSRRPALIGLASAAIGAGVIAVGGASRIAVAAVALALIGAAGGITVAPTTSVAMAAIPVSRSGMASGMVSTQRGLGSTAGFAIMGSVLATVLAATLPGKLEPIVPDGQERAALVDRVTEEANPQAVVGVIGPRAPIQAPGATEKAVVDAADDAFIAGIRVAMLVGCGIVLTALVLAWFMFPRHPSRARAATESPYAGAPGPASESGRPSS
jgi:EmrB/QacA subfamily drug resistance transporter